MSSERENARLKQRVEALNGNGSASAASRGSSSFTSSSAADVNMQQQARVRAATSSSSRTQSFGGNFSTSDPFGAPPPPPPPSSSSQQRHHQQQQYAGFSAPSVNTSQPVQQRQTPTERLFSSAASSASSGVSGGAAPYSRAGSTSTFSSKPPTPPSMSSSVASTASAAAVSLSSRRSTSSARSPREISVLIDKLLTNVHGAPSPMTTRRAVIRLSDATSEVNVDSVSVSAEHRAKLVAQRVCVSSNPLTVCLVLSDDVVMLNP